MDAGVTAVVEFDLDMNRAAAAKHESDSEFKQANGTAAACCPTAAVAALLRLFVVMEVTKLVNADALAAAVCDLDQMDGTAAARHKFVSDLLLVNGLAAACLLAAAGAAFLGVCTILCLERLIGCTRCFRFLDLESMRFLGS